MAESNKIYKGVYVMKLIMAYLVVAIHTTDWHLMGLLDTAVPYFFLASGFFLFRKLGRTREEDLRTIRKWIGKVLKLYLIWTAIYLPFTIIGFIQDGLSLKMAAVVFLRNLVFVGENYLSWPLWYLLAMIWGGILIFVMRWSRIPIWGMFLFGLTIYLFSILVKLDNYPLFIRVFKASKYAFFFSTLFLVTGGYVYQWEITQHTRNKPLIRDIILLLITYPVLRFFPDYGVLLFTVVLFLFSLHLELGWLPTNKARDAGSMSKTIYLTHMLFVGLATILASMTDGWALWLFAAGCSSLLALGLLQIQGEHLSWII